MRTATTRPRDPGTLSLAFELGNTEWVVAMTTGMDQPPLRRQMPARALKTLEAEITRAKAHFGLPATAPVCSCYEAGRDGFWLHRYLVSRGVANRIVESSSIEVSRRRRRTKPDRLDAAKLVTMRIRAEAGEKKVWSVVNVPTSVEEDRRQVHRELLFARRDRGRHTNRMKGLLASQGVPLVKLREFPTHARTARRWDGTPLPRSCWLVSRGNGTPCRPTPCASAPSSTSAARSCGSQTTQHCSRATAQSTPGDWDRQRLALRDGVLRVARVPQSPAGRWARWSHGHALSEWRSAARTGDLESGEPLGPRTRDQYGVGVAALPAQESARAVVPEKVREGE